MNFCQVIKSFFVLVALFSTFFSNADENKRSPVNAFTYYSEVYPPSSFVKNGKPAGYSVELLKLIWQDMNWPVKKIHIVPWARGYKNVMEKEHTVLFAMSKTKSRSPLFKWVGPIYDVSYLVVKKSNLDKNIRSIRDSRSLPIVVIRNDITEQLVMKDRLSREGVITAPNMEQSIKMFVKGRVPLLAISDSGYREAKNNKLLDSETVEVVGVLDTVGDYYAFNKKTPEHIIQAFQTSLENLKKEQASLKQKYKLD